jgi:hypothetical protein
MKRAEPEKLKYVIAGAKKPEGIADASEAWFGSQ